MATERIRQGELSLTRRASKELSLRLTGIIHQKGPIDDPHQIRSRVALIEEVQVTIGLTCAYADLLDDDTLTALRNAGVPVSVYSSSPNTRLMLVDHQHAAFLIPTSGGDGKITEAEQYIVKNYKYAGSWIHRITGYPKRIFDVALSKSPLPPSHKIE